MVAISDKEKALRENEFEAYDSKEFARTSAQYEIYKIRTRNLTSEEKI
ncbi:MAG: hypothetical protein ACK5LL_10645 [Suipraeoptans sp.]